MFKNWVQSNIKNFNKIIKTEEDVKNKIVVPYLKSLGYSDNDIQYEVSIPVFAGTKKIIVKADIVIYIDDLPCLVIETKRPDRFIDEKDKLQVRSYAQLISTPVVPYACVINGIDCLVIDVRTGIQGKLISKKELIALHEKSKPIIINDLIKKEIGKTLLTLQCQDELYKIIKECKTIIENRAAIRSDTSFREMTKILLVKMSEEKRVELGKANRFDFEYIHKIAEIDDSNELTVFKKLFQDAKTNYSGIYDDEDVDIKITSNQCVVELIKLLEPWSFTGTGDDIKGSVYEIFLKTTLRGEFDQYFTPREIVNFMVQYADPCIGDVILDTSCGSGGFLINSFLYVKNKINNAQYPPIIHEDKSRYLTEKCLWGHETDKDLQILAKINLIMHGDGYNNIYHGDTLVSKKLPENFADIILTNPPFTIKTTDSTILSLYENGLGKESEELDILFLEKGLKCLNQTGEIYIVLPEGLLNTSTYLSFREWLLKNVDIKSIFSLPEGAFIPFGSSVSKTCILCARKKSLINPIKKIFVGNAKEVGYECGKKLYKQIDKNDLNLFLRDSCEYFDYVKTYDTFGECGWLDSSLISPKRIDAPFLLNCIDINNFKSIYSNLVLLKDICRIYKNNCKPKRGYKYLYLEVPDISNDTGLISNVRVVDGDEINGDRYIFKGGDLLFTRINTRISRVSIVPSSITEGIVSKEVFVIRLKCNPYIKHISVLCAILQSSFVQKQIVRLSTGSSSSRARVQPEDFLNEVYIQIPDQNIIKYIQSTYPDVIENYWNASQKFLNDFVKIQNLIGATVDKNKINKV